MSNKKYQKSKHYGIFRLLLRSQLTKKYYFSEPVEINIQGVSKFFSTEGDISYFPKLKTIGINLEDEENTLGLERYELGKIEGNLFMIQRLKSKEEVQLKFILSNIR